MKSSSRLGRKKAAVGFGAILLLAASLITVSAAVSAQSGPTADCSNDNAIQFGTQFFGSADLGNHLLSSGPVERSYAYDLAPGVYEISAVSTDGYLGRELVTQDEEQWFAQFLAADGSIIDTSAVTDDVPDFVEIGIWPGSLGSVTIDQQVATVRIVHNAPGATSSPNSVRPVCLGASLTAEIPVATCDAVEAADGSVSGVDSVTGEVCDLGGSDAGTCDAVEAADGSVSGVDSVTGEVCDLSDDLPGGVLDESTTNPDEPNTEVLQDVVTAPVAQVQPGDPTFTG